MHLYIVRHAIAAERGAVPNDADRPLTEEGRERFSRVVAALLELEVKIDRILYSPWVRARQTGELMAPLCTGDLKSSDRLIETPSRDLLEELTEPTMAIVGHEPWMGEAAALLTTGRVGDGAAFRFKKGGVAWLAGDSRPAGMELRGFGPPRWTRQMV